MRRHSGMFTDAKARLPQQHGGIGTTSAPLPRTSPAASPPGRTFHVDRRHRDQQPGRAALRGSRRQHDTRGVRRVPGDQRAGRADPHRGRPHVRRQGNRQCAGSRRAGRRPRAPTEGLGGLPLPHRLAAQPPRVPGPALQRAPVEGQRRGDIPGADMERRSSGRRSRCASDGPPQTSAAGMVKASRTTHSGGRNIVSHGARTRR